MHRIYPSTHSRQFMLIEILVRIANDYISIVYIIFLFPQ